MADTVKDSTYRSEKYNPHELEPRWQQQWQADKLYEIDLSDASKPKYYFLTMYPYPSGDLHAGHWYAEAPADAAARFKRMQGYNVLFPMGFDAFGLPAENAAIKRNIHPATWTYSNIERMTEQFKQMGAMFDWSKRIVTCDPQYYRWNQWFFTKFYEKGLAYKKLSPVDWCPSCNTTLAREQVVGDERRCERCGTPVIKKNLSQWYFKITDYADELLDFAGMHWPDKVKTMQTNWIGRSEGAEVTFKSEQGDDITVFTTRPDTLWGATFMVLAPEHPLVDKLTTDDQRGTVNAYVERASRLTDIDRQAEGKEKTGEFTGAYAVNPVNDARIPIWIADYVLMSYGTGAIMAVPYGDQRDFEFARKFGLDIVPVVRPDGVDEIDEASLSEAYAGPGVLINSGPLDGKVNNGDKGRANPAVAAAIDWLEHHNAGREQVTYRLRDWLVSRQRYWGTPIPMVYCDACGVVPVPEDQLPVELPSDVAFVPTGESPLRSHEGFLNTTCPECGGAAQRETDTMDTFIDSSWYFFRYLSPNLESAPFDRTLANAWMPVEQYTGGIEHAILHLLYARFFTKVIRDLGLSDVDEPFTRMFNQGMILGEDNEKMSKSRGNVVNPDELVTEYGADTVRAYLMFIGPWDEGGPWNSDGINGITKFFSRVWNLMVEAPAGKGADGEVSEADRKALRRAVHVAIKEVSEDMGNFQFNTAIAELMTLSNAMNKAKNSTMVEADEWREATHTLLTLLAPIAPHLSEELWHRLGNNASVHLEVWPSFDPAAIELDTVTMAVQVNGKVRAQIEVAKDASKADILVTAKADDNVARYVEGANIAREIVVPGKLVNLVVK